VTIWFTSDPHFFHENILIYDKRPFKDVIEMNQFIIEGWNSVVKDDDIVYILGDFGLTSLPNMRDILGLLRGKKVLILGNHDRHSRSSYYKVGFYLVLDEATLKIGKTMFKLSHYPYRESKFKQWWHKVRTGKNYYYINRCRPTKGIEGWLLHGHIHSGAVKINRKKKEIHVGCYLWDYKPININQINSLIHEDVV